jgi:hypothetical protein
LSRYEEGGSTVYRESEQLATYEAKYPKATGCLSKDREALLAFYDFPAEHWRHIRTTNPIESTFATVWLRTVMTKGSGSRTAYLTMVFKPDGECLEGLVFIERLAPSPSGCLGSQVRRVDGIEVKDAA